MSQSRKKTALVKGGAGKQRKVIANRRFRRATNVAVKIEREVLPQHAEITNQYDVCDWKARAEKGDDYYNQFIRK